MHCWKVDEVIQFIFKIYLCSLTYSKYLRFFNFKQATLILKKLKKYLKTVKLIQGLLY